MTQEEKERIEKQLEALDGMTDRQRMAWFAEVPESFEIVDFLRTRDGERGFPEDQELVLWAAGAIRFALELERERCAAKAEMLGLSGLADAFRT